MDYFKFTIEDAEKIVKYFDYIKVQDSQDNEDDLKGVNKRDYLGLFIKEWLKDDSKG